MYKTTEVDREKELKEELSKVKKDLQNKIEEEMALKEDLRLTNKELLTSQDHLLESNERLTLKNNELTSLMNNSKSSTILLDKQLSILNFSPSVTKIIGLLTRDIGRTITDFNIGLKYPRFFEDLEVVYNNLIPKEVEVQTIDNHWYSLRITPILTKDNKIEGLAASFTDIDNSKKAEQKLSQSQDKLQERIDELSCLYGISSFSSKEYSTIAIFFQKALNLFSFIWPFPDFAGVKLSYKNIDYKTKNFKETIWKSSTTTIINKKPLKIVVYYLNDSTFNEEEQYFLNEIGNRIKSIIEQKKAEAELIKLNRLKSELMTRTSHELKTPLVAIKGNIDLLLNLHFDNLDSDMISVIENVRNGCLRLEDLIRDLIESSKLESGKIELKTHVEDLSFLIKFTSEELKSIAKKRNQSISIDIHDHLITTFEKEKIYEVINNLLVNAIKYTPPNGVIKIKSEINEGFYIVAFEDNGIGLINEEKESIFKQFGKIEHYGKGLNLGIEGSGLGLYISKRIIELHGGKVWVESEGRNKGSKFSFSLPIIK